VTARSALGRAESQRVQHRRGVPDHIMRLLRRDADIGPSGYRRPGLIQPQQGRGDAGNAGGQRGGSAMPGTGTMPTVAPTRVRRPDDERGEMADQ